MANKNYQYCVAENWGKGFIEHTESVKITFRGYPGNIWQVPANNKFANLWINKVLGVPKTCAEAQAILDSLIAQYQSEWDANNVEGETTEQKDLRLGTRPVDITLEE